MSNSDDPKSKFFDLLHSALGGKADSIPEETEDSQSENESGATKTHPDNTEDTSR